MVVVIDSKRLSSVHLLSAKRTMKLHVRYSLLSRLILFYASLVCMLVQGSAAKSRKCTVKNGSDIESDVGPFFGYSASHDIPPVSIEYDPMATITKKIGRECKKACSTEHRCGAWRTVLSGNSGGAGARCSLYEQGTFKIIKTNGPVCGRADCRVGQCR